MAFITDIVNKGATVKDVKLRYEGPYLLALSVRNKNWDHEQQAQISVNQKTHDMRYPIPFAIEYTDKQGIRRTQRYEFDQGNHIKPISMGIDASELDLE